MISSPSLDLVYFDAGGGHRAAATALQSVIPDQELDWNVRLLNLQEELDSLDIFRKLTGVRLEDIYNRLLAEGWTLGSAQLLRFMHGVIRIFHPAQVRLLVESWKRRKPDAVVSLVPNFNRALFESLALALPGVPLVTVLTDLADYPPHFWMEKQRQYLICGTDHAYRQALELGHHSSHVFRVSGMILHPRFYATPALDVSKERERLGLAPGTLTGLVMFGSEGSSVMLELAKRLGDSKLDLQLIFICGRNTRLRDRISALRTRNKLVVEGFTKNVPFYMQISDFLIGKAGPGSISEAIHMRLPVIVESNAWTLPQERYNTHWIRDHEVGIVLKNFRQIEAALRDAMQTGALERMRHNTCRLGNRAVYEIPAILRQILDQAADES